MKRKNFVRLVLISILMLNFLFSGVSFGETSSDALSGLLFSDVKQDDEKFDAIYFLSNTGVIEGYLKEGSSDREYRPENDINRAEFLKLIIEGTNKADFVEVSGCFPDVPDDEWYAPYVCLAKENGWISGYPDGTFKPEQTINEAEALKILGNVMDWEITTASQGEEWYELYLNYAEEKNLLSDKEVSELMTRGDIADVVFKNIQVKTFDGLPYDKELIDDLYYYYDISTDVLKDVEIDLDTDLADQYQIYTDWFKNWNDTTWYGDDVTWDDTIWDDVKTDDNYEDVVLTNDVYGIKIADTYPITAGYKATDNIEIQVYDKDGSGIEGREIELYASTGIDYSEKIDVSELGNGIYYGSFSSTLAGKYQLFAIDTKSGVTGQGSLSIEPGVLADAEIIDVVDPFESEDINKAIIKVVGEDKYGNAIPYSWNQNDLSLETSLGKVTDHLYEGGVFIFEITADSWGTADISVVDNNGKMTFDASTSVNFLPLQLVHNKGIEYEKGAEVEIPIYVYFPSEIGTFGSYELTLNYDPVIFDFVEGENLTVEADEKSGILYISGKGENLEINKTGSLIFTALTEGKGEFYADDFVLKDGKGAIVSFLDYFEWIIDISKLFDWILTIKFTDEICIEAFIFPGNTTTQATIQADIDKANDIFKQSGDNCNCSFYLHFTLSSTTNLSQDQWDAVDTDSDGELDKVERTDMRANHPPTNAKCVPVYYVPALFDNTLGLCWTPNTGLDGIAIDNQADFDDRTLAHELMHYVTDNAIVDPTKPGSAEQGADTAGNIMNYDNTGDDMTVKQCEMLDSNLDTSIWR